MPTCRIIFYNMPINLLKVQGDSMLPTLAAGDFVITTRWFFSLKPGNLVVVNHPIYQRIIKRIDRVCPQKGLWLTGDNPLSSVASEHMGWVDLRAIYGKVILPVKATSPLSYKE